MKALSRFVANVVKPSSRRRRLAATQHEAEHLEVRALLSNVTAVIRNRDLRITGDSDNNAVQITQTPSGFIVRGLEQTTINGGGLNSGVFLSTNQPTDDVNISFAAGGNNLVRLIDLDVEDDLIVRGGQQVDAIAVVNGTIGDDVRIRTQGGSDLVLVQVNTVDSVNINTGHGDDKVAVAGTPATASVNNARAVSVNTGRGNDELIVEGFDVSNNFNISTGSDNDAIFVRGSQLNGDLRVRMSSGDDDFFITGSRVSGRASVNGGSGVDHAQLFINPLVDYAPSNIEGNVVADVDERIDDLAVLFITLSNPA